MRIRTIKPEFWRNRKLASLGREIHDFAARLITASDDEGFTEADPALLAGDLYPFDADAQRFIKKSLPELERIGFIIIRGGEHGVICLPKFREHQRINRPTKSRLKPRFEQAVAIAQFSESSVSPHGALTESSQQLTEPSPTEVEREVEREREVEQGSVNGGAAHASDALGEAWNEITTSPLPRVTLPLSKSRRKPAIAALERRPMDDWCRVFRLVNASSYCRGSRGWVADFDWAIRAEGTKPEPASKVLEGSYADAAAPKARDKPTTYTTGAVTL